MLTLTCAGSVGTLPCLGGFTCLAAGSGDGGYWQLAPRSAVALNAGNGAPDTGPDVAVVDELPPADACLLLWSRLVRTTVTTIAATTTATATAPMARVRRRRACSRRSRCRCSLRLAFARRCSLVGTADIPP